VTTNFRNIRVTSPILTRVNRSLQKSVRAHLFRCPDITRCSQYGGNATSERRAANNIMKRPSPERSGLMVSEAGVCFGRSADLTPCDQMQVAALENLVVALEARWAVNRQRRLDFNCGRTELQGDDKQIA
jgi:hypothetical protein